MKRTSEDVQVVFCSSSPVSARSGEEVKLQEDIEESVKAFKVVEADLAALGKKLARLEDAEDAGTLPKAHEGRLVALRKKEEQLRKEKEQLRKKEGQLRKEKEQLRDESLLLLRNAAPKSPNADAGERGLRCRFFADNFAEASLVAAVHREWFDHLLFCAENIFCQCRMRERESS
jgi:hypothetical protein